MGDRVSLKSVGSGVSIWICDAHVTKAHVEQVLTKAEQEKLTPDEVLVGVEIENITPMPSNLRPTVEHFVGYEGGKASKNVEFVYLVAEQNVRMTIDHKRG